MKTLVSALFILILFNGTILAGGKQALKFNANGEFKILQFTDTHINTDDKQNLKSLEIIETVIANEKPDLVVFTGDIVTQKNPKEAFELISKIVNASKLPWVVVFGNHESERGYTRKKLADLLEILPGCVNRDVGGIMGNSNFILPILGDDQKTGALLYCMDSNAHSALQPNVGGYGWFDFSQIDWYRTSSKAFTSQNKGIPLPALAFFHIPLPEYTPAFNQKNSVIFGGRTEDECSPVLNSGMFTAMLESGDVMGTFVGHDHLNDYIAGYHGIALAYGRVSKIMKNKEDPLAGGRVIVLKLGKREFDTWIREFGGNKVLQCTFPTSFQK